MKRRNGAVSSGRTWDRRTRFPSSSRLRGRRPKDAREHRESDSAVQLGADSRRRDRFGAQFEPAFVGLRAGARRRRGGDLEELAASVDGQGAAHAGASHELRLPLCRAAPPDSERRHARLRALDRVRRAGHRADSAEQPVQRRQHQRAVRRHQHRVLFHGVGTCRQDAGNRNVAQVSRTAGRHRSRRVLPAAAQSRQPLLAGSRSDEGGQLHGHQGLSESGHRDVGDDGRGRGSHRRAARRERCRGGRISPPHARRAEGVSVGRSGHRHRRQGDSAQRVLFQAMVPKDTDWKQYAAHPVWVEPAGEAAPELESNYQVQV